jgi:hypothetical protein
MHQAAAPPEKKKIPQGKRKKAKYTNDQELYLKWDCFDIFVVAGIVFILCCVGDGNDCNKIMYRILDPMQFFKFLRSHHSHFLYTGNQSRRLPPRALMHEVNLNFSSSDVVVSNTK